MGKFCGPSSEELNLEAQNSNLSRTLDAAFSSRFAGQTDILNGIKGQLSELASGQTPEGFAAPELAAMTTSILNNSAAATRNAQQAARNYSAGQGGGAGSGLTSGVQAQIAGSIASDQAGKEAEALSKLTQMNYGVGRENLEKSIAGLQTLAGQYDPLAYGQAAGQMGSTAFSEADKIKQEQNQASAGIFGAIGGLAKTALGFIPGVGPLISGGLGVLSGGRKGPLDIGTDLNSLDQSQYSGS